MQATPIVRGQSPGDIMLASAEVAGPAELPPGLFGESEPWIGGFTDFFGGEPAAAELPSVYTTSAPSTVFGGAVDWLTPAFMQSECVKAYDRWQHDVGVGIGQVRKQLLGIEDSWRYALGWGPTVARHKRLKVQEQWLLDNYDHGYAAMGSGDHLGPQIGFINGLGTAGKAFVNGAADTGAGFVSLGFWDPDDVLAVDPLTDLGYGASRGIFGVVQEVGLGFATAGVGTALKGAGYTRAAAGAVGFGFATDAVGFGRGSTDIYQNGLSWANGAETVGSAFGLAPIGLSPAFRQDFLLRLNLRNYDYSEFAAAGSGEMLFNVGTLPTPRYKGSAYRDLNTGEGFGVADTPARLDGVWTSDDLRRGLYGHSPRSLGSPDLHHAGQMPGSGIHEINDVHRSHRNNPVLHPNKYNQGVTPAMRTADRELHWWYRAQEEGAHLMFPGDVFD